GGRRVLGGPGGAGGRGPEQGPGPGLQRALRGRQYPADPGRPAPGRAGPVTSDAGFRIGWLGGDQTVDFSITAANDFEIPAKTTKERPASRAHYLREETGPPAPSTTIITAGSSTTSALSL